MPTLGFRGAHMQKEKLPNHLSLANLFEFKPKSNELKTTWHSKSSHGITSSCITTSFKAIDESKLHHENISCSWAVTALPHQLRISSRDLSLKQLWILGTEMIFTLPRSLFLRMMRPLHLHELDGLVARLALRSLKNTDWTL